MELIVVDNRYQPKIALRSADYLIREQVDLVIEFQTDEIIAPAIAAKYLQAHIPFIAIDIPHPGATYFGANNYQAGLMAGQYLGRWAKRHWNGEVGRNSADRAAARRLSAQDAHARHCRRASAKCIRMPEQCRTVSIDGDGQFQTTHERVRKYLRESKARRILVGAVNDSSALGRSARVSGSRPRQRLRHCRPECRAGSARRTARPRHAASSPRWLISRKNTATG